MLVAYVIYLVAINAFLAAGGYAWALSAEPDVDGRVQRAWSWWPGHIEGKGLDFVVHDPSVEAHIRLDRFALDMSLLALLKKEVRMSSVLGDGVAFRLRMTRHLPELCAEGRGVPPIPDRNAPPQDDEAACLRQEDTARDPGPKPDPEGLVRAWLEGVRVRNLRELWLDKVRVELEDAHLDGRWYFWPTREIEIGLEELVVGSARSEAGPNLARFRGLGMHLSGQLSETRFDEMSLAKVWKQVGLQGWVRVREADLHGLRAGSFWVTPYAMPNLPGVRGKVVASATVAVERGEAQRLDARIAGMRVGVSWRDRQVSGRLEAHARLGPHGGGGLEVASVRAEMSRLQLRTEGEDPHEYEGARAWVELEPGGSLSPGDERATLPLRVGANRSALLVDLIPSTLAKLGAEVTVGDASLDARATLRVDGSRVWLEGVKAEAGAVSVEGNEVQLEPKPDGKLDVSVGPVTLGHDVGD